MQFKRLMLFSFMLVLFIGITACSNDQDEKTKDDSTDKPKKEQVFDPKPDPDAKQISSYNEERMDEQKKKDKDILSEYKKGQYTYDDPFIKVDPYDASPLSALVMFETKSPTTVKVTVGHEKYEEPVTNEWKEAKKSHEIPVLGLYPDKENKVTLEITNQSGKTAKTELTIKTDPLPDDFMETTLTEAHQEDMEDGLTYIVPTSGYLYAVDANADVRWYSSLRSRLVYTQLKNGHYVQTTRKDDESQYNELIELDKLGKMYHAYTIDIEGYEDDNLIHHDVIELPNGNLLATVHEPGSEYEEDHMSEIDRKTGKTTQEINLRDVMPDQAPDEYDGKNAERNDWIHQNAVWFDEEDDSILVSGRSQDVILKMSYPNGKLKWILGADEKWPDEYKDYVLKPKGDVDFPAGQHAMKIVDHGDDKGKPHIKDIILFDNNEVFTRGDEEASEQYSQAIRYEVNEKEKTVKETWSYGKERGKDFFSRIIGNVQYLYDQDNLLLNSGATEDVNSPTGTTGKVVEVDATDSDSEPIFELEIRGKTEDAVEYTYRAWRLPLYPKKEWHFQLDS